MGDSGVFGWAWARVMGDVLDVVRAHRTERTSLFSALFFSARLGSRGPGLLSHVPKPRKPGREWNCCALFDKGAAQEGQANA